MESKQSVDITCRPNRLLNCEIYKINFQATPNGQYGNIVVYYKDNQQQSLPQATMPLRNGDDLSQLL